MKIAGIIGGVSWHSTKLLYEYVNTRVAQEKGGLNCARMVMINVNLQEIVQAGNSKEKENIIVDAALRAERAGAEFITLCSNGLHQYAQCIENAVNIPFIHIADVTADAILTASYSLSYKIGMAVGSPILGYLLAVSSYKAGAEVQTAGVCKMCFYESTLIPGLIYILALIFAILMRKYEKRIPQMQKEIEQRQK